MAGKGKTKYFSKWQTGQKLLSLLCTKYLVLEVGFPEQQFPLHVVKEVNISFVLEY
jgi:hypothetical protein